VSSHHKPTPPRLLQNTWTTVRFPQKGTVFDYYVNWKAAKFAPW